MKIFLSCLVCLWVVSSTAQKNITNNINKVKTLNIYGDGKIVIAKATINQTITTKLYLINYIQQKDSSGMYTTTVELGNNERLPLFDVNVALEFDQPIISVDFLGGGNRDGSTDSYENGKKAYWLKAGQVGRPLTGNVLIRFVIKSENKIFTTIKGIDGKL